MCCLFEMACPPLVSFPFHLKPTYSPFISLSGNLNAPLIFMLSRLHHPPLLWSISGNRKNLHSFKIVPRRGHSQKATQTQALPRPFGQSASGLHRVHPMKPTVTWLASLLALLSVALPLVASAGPPVPPEGSRWKWSWLPYKSTVDRRSIGSEFEGHNSTSLLIEHRCTVYTSI